MYSYLKRALDIVLSLLGMVLLSPLFLLLTVLIKLDSKGPVFFRQERIGRFKRHFYIVKFRSMRADAPGDVPTHLLADPSRHITRVGAFLRRTSLDELPQFWNIFVGDMSIVGPRPALWNQYDLIAERDRYGANDIRPGLTGLAQVSGRDELPIEVKARYDGEYVKRRSLMLDIKLFLITLFKVFRREGVVEGADPREERDVVEK